MRGLICGVKNFLVSRKASSLVTYNTVNDVFLA